MSSRLDTLLLDANGYGKVAATIDTVLHGILRLPEWKQLPFGAERVFLFRMLFGQRYEHLSYVRDWRDAFCESPELDVTTCNILDRIQFSRCLKRIAEYDLIIVLHSAAGDRMEALARNVERLRNRSGKLVVFLGNEHDLVTQKKDFIRDTGADFICTQFPIETGRWLYEDCRDAQVVAMPHALNPDIYRGLGIERSMDVGFVGALYDRLIGDKERTNIVQYFQRHGEKHGLRCDIRLRTGNLMTKHRNLVRDEWCAFLCGVRSIVGAEAGSHWIDKTGERIAQAKAYLRKHPMATFEDVHERFYSEPPGAVSGKAISSRHFEPLGTKTCQVLVEGHYNGILEPNVHYIPVKRDMSNIEDVVEKIKDHAYVGDMAERAYEYAMDCHTYKHRVAELVGCIRSGEHD